MSIPVSLATTSGTSQGPKVQRSLRFRSSASAYLSRTFGSPTSNQKGTWSGWVKRGTLGVSQFIFSAANYEYVRFLANDKIEISQPSATPLWTTTQVFRDPSAWYHIVVTWDTTQATAADRCKLWVNGSQVTAWDSAAAITQNTAFSRWNINTYTGDIGDFQYNHTGFFDGYMADVYWVDGQQLTPSSFGYTNSYGVWQPTRYTGTYGTNGFYLPFTDNTSATTLAYDKSGNGNNWTANNISTTAGATYDSMTDVPTLTSATAANYCVLNPLASNVSGLAPQQGNLYWGNNATYNSAVTGTIGVSSGKWYWECKADSAYYFTGISAIPQLPANIAPHQVGSQSKIYYSANGQKYDNGSNAVYGATWGTADICGVALDMDAGTITFYKNNVSQGTAYSGLSGTYWPVIGGANGANVGWINFGQRPFSYTPPTGFKALNTFNLPDPTIKKPNQYMDATLYTGNGSTQTITNAGGFQPDLVWIKNRVSSVEGNIVFDSSRGTLQRLITNLTDAEQTAANSLTSYNSNGFSLGSWSGANTNANAHVGWQWKESATAGFDIVTYTGTGSNTTVAHSLGVAPKMMFIKNRASATNWIVYSDVIGAGNILQLNTTVASTAASTAFNSTAPTSSVFSVGTSTGTNQSGVSHVAYLFAEIAGFSKAFSYTGNGSADGPMVWCGFQPRFILQKRTDSTGDWRMIDTARGTYNVIGPELQANQSAAEYTGNNFDVLSNGFKLRSTGAPVNASGGTYIGMAFASNPFKYSNAF